MSIELLAIISALSFLFASFFAGAETAIIASDRIRLRHEEAKGDKRAKHVLGYLDRPEHFLSTVLVGTNLGVIGCTTTFTAIMIHFFGDSGATVATVILVPALLIFEEVIPKGLFLYYADRAAVLSIYPLRFSATVLYPVIAFFSAMSNLLMKLFRVKKIQRNITMTMEELLFHLRDSRDAGLISGDTMTMATRAFELIDFRAQDVMIPLERVVMAEGGLSVEEYEQIFLEEEFSRLPVYRSQRHNVIGVIAIYDLLKARGQGDDLPPVEEAYMVDLETPIVEMMVRMKNQGSHMAMIRDRAQVVVGMATLEDILERLVGAIADEFH